MGLRRVRHQKRLVLEGADATIASFSMGSGSASSTRLKFWGVRGSIPVPGPETLRYGGNTTCVEVRADDEIIVLDAGTGIRALGATLDREFGEEPIKISLLITHMHWDH